MSINGSSTDGEESDIVKGKWARDNRNVDETGSPGMTEVCRREVEEVYDKKKQAEPEVRADPEVDSPKEQQVVHDKVAANTCGCGHVGVIARVQMPGVAKLSNIEHDPVDGHNDRVQGERSVAARVLAKDCITVVLPFGRTVESVPEGRNDEEKPRQSGGDPVRMHAALWIRLTPHEWVDCNTSQSRLPLQGMRGMQKSHTGVHIFTRLLKLAA